MQNLPHLTKVTLKFCEFGTIPSGIEYLKEVTELDLSGCLNIVFLSESIGSLSKLTTLTLSSCRSARGMALRELPESIGNLSNLISLNLSGCSYLIYFPSSMQNLPHLTNVKLTDCHFESIPSGIEYLKAITELDLSSCLNLESLPESIGDLSNLTSVDLRNCHSLISLPTSLRNVSQFDTPLSLASVFTLPLDLDWSQFHNYVTVPSYLQYMIRTHQLTSIISYLSEYLTILGGKYHGLFKRDQVAEVYGLIQKREGAGLVKFFGSMLTNERKEGKKNNGHESQILEWTSEEKKRDGMECLKILFMTVYGMEMKREDWKMVPTGRRMKEMWNGREWDKRWREVGDIMNEEDVMEASIMHLCIPDYEQEQDGLIIPSACSLNALSILLNEISDRKCTYHFPVYDINDQPSNVVIIRNLPSRFNLDSPNGDELTTLIESSSPILSIQQAQTQIAANIYRYSNRVKYPVVRVILSCPADPVNVAKQMKGSIFDNVYLSAPHRLMP